MDGSWAISLLVLSTVDQWICWALDPWWITEIFNLIHGGPKKWASTLPLYECLGIDNLLNLEGVQNFTNLMWPTGNELFWYNFVLVPQLFNFVTYTDLLVFLFLYTFWTSESAHLFAKLVEELYEMVMRMIFESYGLEKDYETLD